MDSARHRGTLGDYLNAIILSAAAMNFRKLLKLAADDLRQFCPWVFVLSTIRGAGALAG